MIALTRFDYNDGQVQISLSLSVSHQEFNEVNVLASK